MRGIQPDTMLRATKAHVTCVVLMLVLFVSREATEAQEGQTNATSLADGHPAPVPVETLSPDDSPTLATIKPLTEPTTPTPPSYFVTFNDSFGMKPAPNAVTTFPRPSGGRTPLPDLGSGEWSASGEAEDQLTGTDGSGEVYGSGEEGPEETEMSKETGVSPNVTHETEGSGDVSSGTVNSTSMEGSGSGLGSGEIVPTVPVDTNMVPLETGSGETDDDMLVTPTESAEEPTETWFPSPASSIQMTEEMETTTMFVDDSSLMETTPTDYELDELIVVTQRPTARRTPTTPMSFRTTDEEASGLGSGLDVVTVSPQLSTTSGWEETTFMLKTTVPPITQEVDPESTTEEGSAEGSGEIPWDMFSTSSEEIPLELSTTQSTSDLLLTTPTTDRPQKVTTEVSEESGSAEGSGEVPWDLFSTSSGGVPLELSTTQSTSDLLITMTTTSSPEFATTEESGSAEGSGEELFAIETTSQAEAPETTFTTTAEVTTDLGSGEGSGEILVDLFTTERDRTTETTTGVASTETVTEVTTLTTEVTTEVTTQYIPTTVVTTTEVAPTEATTEQPIEVSTVFATTANASTSANGTTILAVEVTTEDDISMTEAPVSDSTPTISNGTTDFTSENTAETTAVMGMTTEAAVDTTTIEEGSTSTSVPSTTTTEPPTTEVPEITTEGTSAPTTSTAVPGEEETSTTLSGQPTSTTAVLTPENVTFVEEVIGIVTVDTVEGGKPAETTTAGSTTEESTSTTTVITTSTTPTTTTTTAAEPATEAPSTTVTPTSTTVQVTTVTDTTAGTTSSVQTFAVTNTTLPVTTTQVPTTIVLTTPQPTTTARAETTTNPTTASAIPTTSVTSPGPATFQTSTVPTEETTTTTIKKTTTEAKTTPTKTTPTLGEGNPVLKGRIRITEGLQWSDDLADPTSEAYKKLNENIKTLLTDLLGGSSAGSQVLGVDNIKFKQGSVIVSFDVLLKPGGAMNTTALGAAFTEALLKPGALGNFTADPSFTSFEVTTDESFTTTTTSPFVSSTTTVPMVLQEAKPTPETYPFPDWAIGMVIAAGILVIFIILCCIVLCCFPSTTFGKRNYLVSSQSDGSPNSSKIEIDMGLDPSYSEQSTLKRSPPSIKKSPPPPTNVPPAPPVPALPANKLNGKATDVEAGDDTLARYAVSSAPGQADNAVSEMADLTGIYVVDNETTTTTTQLQGGTHEFVAANGSVHVNGKEQLMCAAADEGSTSSIICDGLARTFYDEILQTHETFL